MNKLKTSQPVGILNVDYFQNNFSRTTYFPRERLADYIEHYWLISWDMPKGERHQQEVIPHPCTHLTFLKNDSHIQGVCKQKYTHTLQGSGNIVGVKFKPAGFYMYAQQAGIEVKDICDKVVDINSIFNIDITQEEHYILSLDAPLKKIEHVEQLLFSHIPTHDENIAKVNRIVVEIASNKALMKVSDICAHFSIEQRHLQRLFIKYIGISAKWVINRYRLHDALTSVEKNENIDWAELAIELGYYDQAHFIKDFKQLIGKTPKDYHAAISN